LLLGLSGGVAAGAGTDAARLRMHPSVALLSRRIIEYGRKGDLKRLGKVRDILEPFLLSLDQRWGAGIGSALDAALARKDARAAAAQGLRILYWDMRDLLLGASVTPGEKPRALRSRILKARADYGALAPLVRANKESWRLHLGIMKGFQALIREVPGDSAYGVSKSWRTKVAATAGIVLKLAAAALPALHGRRVAK